MKIIVGLGNIGKEYEKTRHNAGFYALNIFEKMLNENDIHLEWKEDKKLKCAITKFKYKNEEIIFAKPTTLMNLSGLSVVKILSFYKQPLENLVVIYDDIDLPLGEIRIRDKGSAGTHNGMKSIIQELGSSEFKRIRIGIESRGDLSPNIKDLSSFVLSKFSEQEFEILKKELKMLDLKAIFT